VHIPITFYADQTYTRPDPADLFYRGVMPVENGGDSGVIASVYLRWQGGPGGGGTFRAAVLTPDIADTGWTTLNPGYGKDSGPSPTGTPPTRVACPAARSTSRAAATTWASPSPPYLLPFGK
jgi:hypothetical protein